MKASRLLSLVVLVVACHALPSAVPLADSAPLDLSDPADLTDRRALAANDAADDEGDDEDEIPVTASDAPRSTEYAPDGGSAEPSTDAAGDGGPEPAWPGEYYGSDRFVWRGADGRESVEVDDRAHTRVESDGAHAVVIFIVNSATGEVICPLHASTLGKDATVRAGETCFGGPDVAASVTDGHATLDADRLVLDFRGHLDRGASNDDDDDDDDDASEEGTYHFDGKRR